MIAHVLIRQKNVVNNASKIVLFTTANFWIVSQPKFGSPNENESAGTDAHSYYWQYRNLRCNSMRNSITSQIQIYYAITFATTFCLSPRLLYLQELMSSIPRNKLLSSNLFSRHFCARLCFHLLVLFPHFSLLRNAWSCKQVRNRRCPGGSVDLIWLSPAFYICNTFTFCCRILHIYVAFHFQCNINFPSLIQNYKSTHAHTHTCLRYYYTKVYYHIDFLLWNVYNTIKTRIYLVPFRNEIIFKIETTQRNSRNDTKCSETF